MKDLSKVAFKVILGKAQDLPGNSIRFQSLLYDFTKAVYHPQALLIRYGHQSSSGSAVLEGINSDSSGNNWLVSTRVSSSGSRESIGGCGASCCGRPRTSDPVRPYPE